MLKLPRAGSLSLQILEFIGSKTGVRYGDIQRFICEKQGKDYDLMIPGIIYDRKTRSTKNVQVRRWKGIWGTNLCHGPSALLNKYCVKGEGDKLWHLSADTANLIADKYDAEGKGRMVYFTNGQPLRPLKAEPDLNQIHIPADLNSGCSNPTPEKSFTTRFEDHYDPKTGERYTRVIAEPIPKQLDPMELIQKMNEARQLTDRAQANLSAARATYERALEAQSKLEDLVRQALNL